MISLVFHALQRRYYDYFYPFDYVELTTERRQMNAREWQ